ncbi:energy-coupling factor ABC transporter permease [Photobacterium sp. 1_MG-2023]|uniref:energy-coupling factor ABC transporter permease n=1 Tax=Photobacterium sp. 1_MG-2023 TaxID=3062646 RepID=UPI0026E45FAE|nr:energy-coupling factor ABC transporter permease [Photobacterium sp. 1_MG-2023]MDO6704594.1 energy-coupling factor ABC transporter permease [Photobacterium sp. 1_MG-2023]
MTGLHWGGWAVWLIILLFTYPKEFYPKFRQERDYQHLVLGSAVALFVLWSLRAGLVDGLQVHFLALTVLALSHGWRIAIWISVIPSLLLAAFGLVDWQDLGMMNLTGVIAPAMISYGIFLLSYRFLNRHLFVYIFVAAFFNGALSQVVYMLLTGGWVWLEGDFSGQYIVDNFLILIPLLLFPEGLLNGMATTLLVVYKPEWVRTFYERDYIYNRDK